jgi:phosphoglycerol transferase
MSAMNLLATRPRINEPYVLETAPQLGLQIVPQRCVSLFFSVGGYAFAALLCCVILTLVLRLWRADLTVPFCYAGDGLLNSLWIKSVVDNGWYLNNPRVGMPEGLEMHDFAVGDSLHFLLMRMLGLIWHDYAIVGNVYFLLGFPFATLTSLFALRKCGVSYIPALVGSLLYAMLPYHLSRGTVHLFLSAYFLIPLMVLVLVWVCQGNEMLFRRDKVNSGIWRNGKTIGSVVICLLVASGGIYYAFFACALLLAAGLAGAVWEKRLYPLATGCALTGILVAAGIVNISPTLWYAAEHGKNKIAGVRSMGESEIYALKLSQLVLPVGGHRIDALAQLNHKYNNNPLTKGNENQVATLGFIGSFGFLFLLGRSLFRRWSPSTATSLPILDALAALNLVAVLLATMGGFGSLLDLAGFHSIRAYNRICVFIAFFSLFAVVLLLDRAWRNYGTLPKARWFIGGGLAALAVLGVLDQTCRTTSLRHTYSWLNGNKTISQFRSDAAFVQNLEANLPHGTMIFQIPYVAFPESPGPTPHMPDCDHFRAYLHSTTLRWSYGAMKGRKTDAWQKRVSEQPLEAMVASLAQAGFGGIYLNRKGLPDDGAALERGLTQLLNSAPLVSDDKTLLFFDLTPLRAEQRKLPGEVVAQ